MRRGRGHQPQTLGNVQQRHRSESRRLSDRRHPVKAVTRERNHGPGALHEGDPVRVFSRSADKWVDGEVMKFVENDFIRVEYEHGEYWCGKTLHLHSEHLSIPTDNTSSAEEHDPCGYLDRPRRLALHTDHPQQLPGLPLDKDCVADYILKRLHGQLVGPPCSYSISSSEGMIVHTSSGVIVDAGDPLVPSSANLSDCIVFYHYTSKEAHSKIAYGKTRSLWATLLATCTDPYDTSFGDGTYATIKSPHEFGSKDAILQNNYGGMWQSYAGRADVCIPIVIPPDLAVDVMTQGVPGLLMKWNTKHDRAPTMRGTEFMDPPRELGEVDHRPGFNRNGQRVQEGRDIWVIRIADPSGNVGHVVDRQGAVPRRRRVADLRFASEIASSGNIDMSNEELARKLEAGIILVEEMPPIQVFFHDGLWWSSKHRRLIALKMYMERSGNYELEAWTLEVPASREVREAWTNKDNGMSVVLRDRR